MEITSTEIASYMDVLICFLRPECLCVSQVCVEILFLLGYIMRVGPWKTVLSSHIRTRKKLPFVTQEQSLPGSADLKHSSSRSVRS